MRRKADSGGLNPCKTQCIWKLSLYASSQGPKTQRPPFSPHPREEPPPPPPSPNFHSPPPPTPFLPPLAPGLYPEAKRQGRGTAPGPAQPYQVSDELPQQVVAVAVPVPRGLLGGAGGRRATAGRGAAVQQAAGQRQVTRLARFRAAAALGFRCRRLPPPSLRVPRQLLPPAAAEQLQLRRDLGHGGGAGPGPTSSNRPGPARKPPPAPTRSAARRFLRPPGPG